MALEKTKGRTWGPAFSHKTHLRTKRVTRHEITRTRVDHQSTELVMPSGAVSWFRCSVGAVRRFSRAAGSTLQEEFPRDGESLRTEVAGLHGLWERRPPDGESFPREVNLVPRQGEEFPPARELCPSGRDRFPAHGDQFSLRVNPSFMGVYEIWSFQAFEPVEWADTCRQGGARRRKLWRWQGEEGV